MDITRKADAILSHSLIQMKGSTHRNIIRRQTFRQSWFQWSLGFKKPPPGVSILMLNDDCLREIFKQSAIGFDELTRLSYVCKRFYYIVAGVARRNTPAIDINGRIHIHNQSIWKMNAILGALGPLIKDAAIYSKSETATEMLLELCPNLKKFSVYSQKPGVTYVLERKRPDVVPPLRFERYTRHLNMDKCVIPATLPQMLYVDRPHVVQLNLYGIRTINLRSFMDFVSGNEFLKQVNFSKVDTNITDFADFFVGCFPNEIEKLTLNCRSNSDSALQIKQYADKPSAYKSRYTVHVGLPNREVNFLNQLIYLKYLRTNQVGDEQMLQIAKDLKELEELYIASKDISYAGTYDVLNAAKKLKIASVTTSCNDYTAENLARINELREQRDLLLDVNAYRSVSNTVRRILEKNFYYYFYCILVSLTNTENAIIISDPTS